MLLRFTDANGQAFERRGECVLTQTGLEGSLIYAASAQLRDAIETAGRVRIALPDDIAVGRHEVVAVYRGTAEVATSSSAAERYVVVRATPTVGTAGTDWSIRRGDPAEVYVQVEGVADVVPTGAVTVWVLGGPVVSAELGPDGTAHVALPGRPRTSLVLVLYGGDDTYTGAVAVPRVLVVR